MSTRLRPLLPVFALLSGVAIPWLLKGSKLLKDWCVGRGENCEYELLLHAKNHSVLHIGGQHRAGTTILQAGLGTHPRIAPQRFADGRSGWHDLHGEGIFLQDVYPRFSLDHPPGFFLRKRLLRLACTVFRMHGSPRCRLVEGIGSYALSPATAQAGTWHGTKGAALTLFRQWAPYWDLSRPILLEKSPSNAVLSPMLHRLWGNHLGTPARFIFVSRHPVMQAMAMNAFVDDLSLRELVEHWLRVEETVRDHARLLRAADGPAPAEARFALLSLEALTAQPERTVLSILAWLGHCGAEGGAEGDSAVWRALPQAATWLKGVRSRPNAKYAVDYRRQLRTDPGAAAQHDRLVADFGPVVGEVSGYQLTAIPRVEEEESAAAAGLDPWELPPHRDAAWLSAWLGREVDSRLDLATVPEEEAAQTLLQASVV